MRVFLFSLLATAAMIMVIAALPDAKHETINQREPTPLEQATEMATKLHYTFEGAYCMAPNIWGTDCMLRVKEVYAPILLVCNARGCFVR